MKPISPPSHLPSAGPERTALCGMAGLMRYLLNEDVQRT
jgi:hypothetical protein